MRYLPKGWRLDEIDCKGVRSEDYEVDLSKATMWIHIWEPGADVECTFYNKLDEEPVTEDPCDGYAIGDVNGPDAARGDEHNINPIDSALILQYNARLIGSLPCPYNADVNLDGNIDAMDALLILQYTAGIVSYLPV
jgi:hypothetical protein